jgi:hypothetical protein
VGKTGDARIGVLVEESLHIVDGQAAPLDARVGEERVNEFQAPRTQPFLIMLLRKPTEFLLVEGAGRRRNGT